MEAKHGLMKDPALYLDALWPYPPLPQQFILDFYFWKILSHAQASVASISPISA